MTKYDVQYSLLSILQHYAPNAEAQQLITTMVNNASLDGASTDEIILMLSGMLIDGLNIGNWPWVN